MHDTIFSKSNKGGAIVISKKAHYTKERSGQLNSIHYTEIQEPNLLLIKNKIQTQISRMFDNGEIDGITLDFLRGSSKEGPRLGRLFLLLKLHKLNRTSMHTPTVFSGFITGEAICHHRNNSNTENLKDTICKFKGHLKQRGYKGHEIHRDCESALNIERSELFRFKQESDKQIPLVFYEKQMSVDLITPLQDQAIVWVPPPPPDPHNPP
ncbi:unnamed protein product [Mytilus coruscus]|uniref:Uncharacterized protein n=1 Tax=Mytilus coruscus TaxID=42192 RepID=A0A6J8DUY0_MYTCO|nr:unnamed protein product [Mytilus coruscus]